MTKLRSRLGVPSPATAIAMLALVVSLGGVAFAADALITGQNVKNNSLTGADVLESSLSKVGNANNLDGKDSTAFGGVTHAFEYGSTAPVPIGGVYANLASSPPLPAGAYSVVARVEAVNDAGKPDAVFCELKTAPDGLVRDRLSHNQLSHYHLTLVGAFALAEGSTVGVDCNGSEGAQATAKLLVTRVDNAN